MQKQQTLITLIKGIQENKLKGQNLVSTLNTIPGKQRSQNIIPIMINNQTVIALVDSGAQISCMSNKTFRQAGLEQTAVKLQNDIPFVKGVDGTTVNIVDKISITIRVGGLDLNQNFYILERMNHSVTLGTDFLRSHEVKIDFGKMEMSLAADKVKIDINKTLLAKVIAVVDDSVTIPAKHQAYLPVTMNALQYNDTIGLLEPISQVTESTNLIGARCVNRIHNNKTTYLVLNPTDEDIHTSTT